VNSATAHAHYEDEATYNIGSSYKGRPRFNIIKILPQIGNGGESSGTIVWCRGESEWEKCECSYVYCTVKMGRNGHSTRVPTAKQIELSREVKLQMELQWLKK